METLRNMLDCADTVSGVEFIYVNDDVVDVAVYRSGIYDDSIYPEDADFRKFVDWFRNAPDDAFESVEDEGQGRTVYTVRLRPKQPSEVARKRFAKAAARFGVNMKKAYNLYDGTETVDKLQAGQVVPVRVVMDCYKTGRNFAAAVNYLTELPDGTAVIFLDDSIQFVRDGNVVLVWSDDGSHCDPLTVARQLEQQLGV